MTYFVHSEYNELLISQDGSFGPFECMLCICRTTSMRKVLSMLIDNTSALKVIINQPVGDDETLAVPGSPQMRRMASASFDRGRGDISRLPFLSARVGIDSLSEYRFLASSSDVMFQKGQCCPAFPNPKSTQIAFTGTGVTL